MPFIRLPYSVFELYAVHRDYAHPSVLKQVRGAPPNFTSYLLIHTRTGAPLSTTQVTKTLKSFFSTQDGSLDYVTPLVIRRSYATIMYRRYLRGDVYAGKARQEFLRDLADSMNTSVDQLEQSYFSNESAQGMLGRLSKLHSHSVDD